MMVQGGHIQADEHSGLVSAHLSGSACDVCGAGVLPSLNFNVRGPEKIISSNQLPCLRGFTCARSDLEAPISASP